MGEITIEEIFERGIKLPDEKLSFPVEEFDSRRSALRGVGGIYTFTNESEGWLYVGISADLNLRVCNHINGDKRGKRSLNRVLRTSDNVILTLYAEKNVAMREFYENYLIAKHDPMFNVSKKNKLTDGYDIAKNIPKHTQDRVVMMYEDGILLREIERLTGIDNTKLNRILSQYGVTRNRNGSQKNKLIIHQYEEGMSQIEISKSVGLSTSNVQKVVSNHLNDTDGKTRNQKIKDRDDLIWKMYLAGDCTYKEIAERLGVTLRVTHRTITNRRKEANMRMLSKSEIRERNQEIIRLIGEGWKRKDIAEKFSITVHHVNKVHRNTLPSKEAEQQCTYY